MNLNHINNHIKCYNLLTEAGLDTKLTSRCSADNLITGIEQLITTELNEDFSAFEFETQVLLFSNRQLMERALLLLGSPCFIEHIEALLTQLSASEFLEIPLEQLTEVTSDATLVSEYLGSYIRYFHKLNLTDENKTLLWKCLSNCAEKGADTLKLAQAYPYIFYSETVASSLLHSLTDYDKCLHTLSHDLGLSRICDLLAVNLKNAQLSDDAFRQLSTKRSSIEPNLDWASGFFTEEEFPRFLELLVNSMSIDYDLENLKSKVESGKVQEAHQMIQNRVSYIAFYHGKQFVEEWGGLKHEDLMLYAIVNNKKAFLSLVSEKPDLYRQIPDNSILFEPSFYKENININTLNAKNLKQCINIPCRKTECLKLLSGTKRTFNEVATLYPEPVVYTQVYTRLCVDSIDTRLKIIKELINVNCLSMSTNATALAARLSEKPMSVWMQKDFAHIADMSAEACIKLLQYYSEIQHLIPSITNVAEVYYMCNNIEVVSECATLDEVHKYMITHDKDWLAVQDALCIDSKVIAENQEHVLKFICNNGAHIVNVYRKHTSGKEEILSRLVSAELLGRFNELKYFDGDLEEEISYSISSSAKKVWMHNSRQETDSLTVYEEDAFIPVMQIGVIPTRSCLSYSDGSYSQCLLACHDANKKIIFLKYNGKVVLRAILRLTKGIEATGNNDTANTLEFADLTKTASKKTKKEKLVLFLEKYYTAGLPQQMQETALQLLLTLVKDKARALHATLVCADAYSKYDKSLVKHKWNIYISKSKAGTQYLDSLGGSVQLHNEGKYYKGNFLTKID